MSRIKKRLSTRDPVRLSARSSDVQSSPLIFAFHRFSVMWAIVAMAGIGVLLRLWNVAATVDVSTSQTLLGDAAGYYQWGQRIASGDWYGSETFYQAPLYPYFLAVKFKCFGVGVTGARVVQAILGAISVFAIGLASSHWFGKRAGLVASFMLAIYSPAIFYDGIIQKASLGACLLCCFLASCAWLDRDRAPWRAFVCGLLLGLLALTRENTLLWIPLVPCWIYFASQHGSAKRKSLEVAGYALGVAVILFPVAARNASLGGEWSPTTFQAGPNFYIGNHAQADGIYRPLVPGRGIPLYERSDAVRLAEKATGKELSSREVSTYWMSRTRQEIYADPARWLQLIVQKMFMVVNDFEVPDVESMSIYQERSAPLLLTSFWNFGLLFPLAVAGIWLHRRELRSKSLLLILLLTMFAAVVMFFVLGRYRLPIAVLLFPWAAYAVTEFFAVIQAKQWRRLVVPIALMIVAWSVAKLPVHDTNGLEASSLMNAGVAIGRAGNLKESVVMLRRAVLMAPESGVSHYNLGIAWQNSGRFQRAQICFRTALLVDPTLYQAQEALDQLANQR